MQVKLGSVQQLREGLRSGSVDDMWQFVRKQVAEQNIRLNVSPELREAARQELAPGGYWNPEAVANRILGFAQAWAGDDPDKQKKALEAVRKGFAMADKMLGGLPEVSQQTRTLVEEKFQAWMNSAR